MSNQLFPCYSHDKKIPSLGASVSFTWFYSGHEIATISGSLVIEPKICILKNTVYVILYVDIYRYYIHIWYTHVYAHIWLYSLLNAAGCMILFWPAKIARHVGGAPSRMCPPCLGRLTRSPPFGRWFHGISWDFMTFSMGIYQWLNNCWKIHPWCLWYS